MLKTINVDDLDDLQYRMKCAVDMVGALQEVLENGNFQPQAYSDAVFGAYDYLNGLVKELETFGTSRTKTA